MKQFGFLRAVAAGVLGVVGLLAGGCAVNVTDADIQPITLAGLRKVMEDPKPDQWTLLDARGPAEFAQERIPGAVNRPLDTFSGRQGDVDPTLTRYALIAVYGNNPGSAPAKAVVKRLLASGYGEVYFYSGGLEEWRRSGLNTDGLKAAVPVSPAGTTPPAAPAPR